MGYKVMELPKISLAVVVVMTTSIVSTSPATAYSLRQIVKICSTDTKSAQNICRSHTEATHARLLARRGICKPKVAKWPTHEKMVWAWRKLERNPVFAATDAVTVGQYILAKMYPCKTW